MTSSVPSAHLHRPQKNGSKTLENEPSAHCEREPARAQRDIADRGGNEKCSGGNSGREPKATDKIQSGQDLQEQEMGTSSTTIGASTQVTRQLADALRRFTTSSLQVSGNQRRHSQYEKVLSASSFRAQFELQVGTSLRKRWIYYKMKKKKKSARKPLCARLNAYPAKPDIVFNSGHFLTQPPSHRENHPARNKGFDRLKRPKDKQRPRHGAATRSMDPLLSDLLPCDSHRQLLSSGQVVGGRGAAGDNQELKSLIMLDCKVPDRVAPAPAPATT